MMIATDGGCDDDSDRCDKKSKPIQERPRPSTDTYWLAGPKVKGVIFGRYPFIRNHSRLMVLSHDMTLLHPNNIGFFLKISETLKIK